MKKKSTNLPQIFVSNGVSYGTFLCVLDAIRHNIVHLKIKRILVEFYKIGIHMNIHISLVFLYWHLIWENLVDIKLRYLDYMVFIL